MGKFINLIGQKFGRLLVLERVKNRGHNPCWKCQCDCGNITEVIGSHLKDEHTKSCGCLNRENSTKHGNSCRGLITPEYKAWWNMKERCYNFNNKYYKNYGGRGITVCDRWLGDHGFENFLEDMGKKPGKKYSLERIDNDGNYCKENCRWATMKEQNRNRRSNDHKTYNGKTMILVEWSEELQIPYDTLWSRLYRYGWSIERAFETFVNERRLKCR